VTATDPLSTPKHSMFTSGLTLAALLQPGNVPALGILGKPLTGSVSRLVEVRGVWGGLHASVTHLGLIYIPLWLLISDFDAVEGRVWDWSLISSSQLIGS